jgi:cysteine desulfurase
VSGRVYLDWNATAPLRPEARAAVLAALDAVGNPSSVHAEGRAAWAVVERARAQVARLAGVEADLVVFTSGATEANLMAARGRGYLAAETEHASVLANHGAGDPIPATPDGAPRFEAIAPRDAAEAAAIQSRAAALAVGAANGETGVLVDLAAAKACARRAGLPLHVDAAQAAGRVAIDLSGRATHTAALSAHKLGGPQGVGALIAPAKLEAEAQRAPRGQQGGGQERGWRAGTHNVAGIAGFGAAAEAALRDLETGVWDRVARLRNILEERLAGVAPDAIIIGSTGPRLPNTTCVAVPGWRGETQVMAMDLAGFAVSAGAACSSGRTGPSRALRAMGLDDITAASAMRVSLGPTTTEDEIARFADAWRRAYSTRRPAAA